MSLCAGRSLDRRLLSLLADGQTSKEIAERLSLSITTVQRHIANIYAKIGARNRVDGDCLCPPARPGDLYMGISDEARSVGRNDAFARCSHPREAYTACATGAA